DGIRDRTVTGVQTCALPISFQRVVGRHAMLRSHVDAAGESWICHSQLAADIDIVDLSLAQTAEQQSELQHALQRECETPFRIAEAPLLRARLFKLKEELHLLLLIAHHIAVDGVSMGIVLGELGEIYSALCQGRECGLVPPN